MPDIEVKLLKVELKPTFIILVDGEPVTDVTGNGLTISATKLDQVRALLEEIRQKIKQPEQMQQILSML